MGDVLKTIETNDVNNDIVNKYDLEFKGLKENILKNDTKDNLFELQKNTLIATLEGFKGKSWKEISLDNKWALAVQIALKTITNSEGEPYLKTVESDINTKIDGIYGGAGSKTREAVKQFQQDVGLVGADGNGDGLAGSKTIEKLIDKLKKGNQAAQQNSGIPDFLNPNFGNNSRDNTNYNSFLTGVNKFFNQGSFQEPSTENENTENPLDASSIIDKYLGIIENEMDLPWEDWNLIKGFKKNELNRINLEDKIKMYDADDLIIWLKKNNYKENMLDNQTLEDFLINKIDNNENNHEKIKNTINKYYEFLKEINIPESDWDDVKNISRQEFENILKSGNTVDLTWKIGPIDRDSLINWLKGTNGKIFMNKNFNYKDLEDFIQKNIV